MEKKITFISASAFSLHEGAQVRKHSHIYHQLYYVVDGNPVFVVDGAELHPQPGDIFYISPRITHQILPLQEKGFKYLEFKVQINDPFIKANLKPTSLMVAGGEYAEFLLRYIFDNWRSKEPQNIENVS